MTAFFKLELQLSAIEPFQPPLGKKGRLSGRVLRVAEIAQADADQAKPLVRAEDDTL